MIAEILVWIVVAVFAAPFLLFPLVFVYWIFERIADHQDGINYDNVY